MTETKTLDNLEIEVSISIKHRRSWSDTDTWASAIQSKKGSVLTDDVNAMVQTIVAEVTESVQEQFRHTRKLRELQAASNKEVKS